VAKRAALLAILRKTMTWDQGNEMANHVAIAALDIFFCAPNSPWQRGTNERHQRTTRGIQCGACNSGR
jgi:IS30 family transposase